MQRSFQAVFLLFGLAAACDSGLDWSAKKNRSNDIDTTLSVQVDRSSWPKARREHAERISASMPADTWPFGADATSFSATITWEKMEPALGGNVFVSNFLNEGCGSGYVGAQMHYNESKMYADWAIWDIGGNSNTKPMSAECVRYDGEGHGTQCGVEPNKTWEIGTPYTFNVSLIASNASGAHFKAFIKNEKNGDVYKLGEIFTEAPTKAYNCSRLTVGSSPFQEIYTGGNFTNIVSVEGPIFRGVQGHPADVMPTGATNCYYHHSCYGKDGLSNCRNESSSFCMPPNCTGGHDNKVVKTTFSTGHTPVPSDYIAPWDKNPDVLPSQDCWFGFDHALSGGTVPEHWGMPIMPNGQDLDHWRSLCCGWCLADPSCLAAQLYGNQCTLHHNSSSAPTPVKGPGLSVIRPMKGAMSKIQRAVYI